MFHNYFFLRRLSRKLDKQLNGAILVESFSQSKDELILGFQQKDNSEFYIKASLEQQLGLLSFPGDFKRARKNSIDLFPEVPGSVVKKITQYAYERSFCIEFDSEFALIFKMHGGRSNILLTRNSKVVDVFRSNLKHDFQLDPASLHRNLDLTRSDHIELLNRILGPQLRNEFPDLADMRAEEIQRQLDLLQDCPLFLTLDPKPDISLIQGQDALLETQDPIKACNELFRYITGPYLLIKEKEKRIQEISRTISRSENYITKCRKKVNDLQTGRKYDEVANIIMANLHAIPAHSGKVTLHDFYRDSDITITLKPQQSPQKLAENYYRKSKNQRLEIENLESNIRQKENHIQELFTLLSTVEKAESLKVLRKLEPVDETNAVNPEQLPYHEHQFMGFRIWIGKNAKANDLLTFRYGKKNDLWLHAKDVAGSHVLIKEIPGQTFPKPVIERAAQLAAHHSRRKTDSLCPVIHTARKYVRKVKGAPPGQVRVDQERVLLVEPRK